VDIDFRKICFDDPYNIKEEKSFKKSTMVYMEILWTNSQHPLGKIMFLLGWIYMLIFF